MAFDIAKLQQMLSLAGKYAPQLEAAIQEIISIFVAKQGAGVGAVQCNGAVCEALCAVKKAQMDALVKTLQLECAISECHPDE